MKLEMRQEAWLATDFVTDLTDGWPQEGVGWVVSNGFGNGFNGWLAAAGRTVGLCAPRNPTIHYLFA